MRVHNYQKQLSRIPDETFDAAIMSFRNVSHPEINGFLYFAGNGGSAAISNHFECDIGKGLGKGHPWAIKARSLVSNPSMLMAIANDIGYDEVISFQLEKTATPNDAVILISSSGNSPNIVKAAKVSKNLGVPVIGFTGFDGGGLKELSDINFHIPVHDYGIVEDCHHMNLRS